MKSKWVLCDEKVFGLNALQHSITNELCVFSEIGELWQFDEVSLRILVHSDQKKALKEFAKLQGIKTPKLDDGEQFIFKLNIKDLAVIIKKFKPLRANMQLIMANKI